MIRGLAVTSTTAGVSLAWSDATTAHFADVVCRQPPTSRPER
jgi:hypothetical protein